VLARSTVRRPRTRGPVCTLRRPGRDRDTRTHAELRTVTTGFPTRWADG
jgi:hypothetical protein